jgi:hypothetical protein
MLKENMRKAGSKICSINIDTAEFREIDFLATRAKNLKS